MASTTIDLALSCDCKRTRGTLTLPASSLPLQMYLCHCTSCKAFTGQLCATVVAVPEDATFTPAAGAQGRGYRTSAAAERFFCATCGGAVWDDAGGIAEGMVFLMSGAFCAGAVEVDSGRVEVLAPGGHVFVASSRDGGMRDWLTGWPGWAGWVGDSAEVPAGALWGSVRGAADGADEASDELRCRCHCGGVDFAVARPRKGDRYAASLCACGQCRQTSGDEVGAWARVPAGAVRPGLEQVLSGGSVVRYESSPGVERHFCGTCSASVAFYREELGDMRALAVGLMQSGSGHRAQDVLRWDDTIAFKESAHSRTFIEQLDQGLKEWVKAAA